MNLGPYYALTIGMELETYFALADEEHNILITSRAYESVDGALDGISQARSLGGDIEAYERWHVRSGYGFTIRGPAGVLANSPPFAFEADRDAAIDRVMACAECEVLADLRAPAEDEWSAGLEIEA